MTHAPSNSPYPPGALPHPSTVFLIRDRHRVCADGFAALPHSGTSARWKLSSFRQHADVQPFSTCCGPSRMAAGSWGTAPGPWHLDHSTGALDGPGAPAPRSDHIPAGRPDSLTPGCTQRGWRKSAPRTGPACLPLADRSGHAGAHGPRYRGPGDQPFHRQAELCSSPAGTRHRDSYSPYAKTLELLREIGLKRIDLERERGGARLNSPEQRI